MPSPGAQTVTAWPVETQPDSFPAAVAFVIDQLEGGGKLTTDEYGGLTRWGIASKWHPGVDVEHLTLEGAEAIYRVSYWDRLRCGEMPPAIGFLVFDMAVNVPGGPLKAVQLLQRQLLVEQDGVVGPDTLDAAKRAPRTELVCRLTERRLREYHDETQRHPPQRKYLNGWFYRATKAAVYAGRLV